MKKNKITAFISFGLILVLLTGSTIGATSISEAQKDVEQTEKELEQVQEQIDTFSQKKKKLEESVAEMDQKMTKLTTRIRTLNEQLKQQEEQIALTREELSVAKKKEKSQYEAMKKRIKFMYENGTHTYLDIMAGAKSFSDFLNRTEYATKVYEFDKNMLETYQETRKSIKEKEKILEEEQEELEALTAEALDQKEELSAIIDEKNEVIREYEASITSAKKKEKEYEAEIKEQNALIKKLEEEEAARRAAEQAAAEKAAAEKEAENQTASQPGGGSFTWPCPSYTRISSDYGYRLHPTLGVDKFHNGIDMAAPSGTSILAASAGTVVSAAYSSTMGNYVMISHGNGVYTIYMHASSLAVLAGANVSKGQVIAFVGSTGRSTGPHLHFSVRINGEYVNPWTYLR